MLRNEKQNIIWIFCKKYDWNCLYINVGNFECPRCHNKDEKYIGEINGKKYCRKCISFSGEHAKEFIYSKGEAKLFLSYPLSKEQQHISLWHHWRRSDKKAFRVFSFHIMIKLKILYIFCRIVEYNIIFESKIQLSKSIFPLS